MYNIDEMQIDEYIRPVFDALEKQDPSLILTENIFFDLNKQIYFPLLPERLKNKKDFILKCLDKQLICIGDAPENLRKKEFISRDLYLKNTEIFYGNLQENLYEQDKEIVEKSLKNPTAYLYINEKFKKDEDLMIKCLLNNMGIFRFLDISLREKILENEELVLSLIKNSPDFFTYLSEEQKRKDNTLLAMISSEEKDKGYFMCQEYLKMNKNKEIALAALLNRDYAHKKVHQIYVSILKKNKIKTNCHNFLKIYLNNKELNNEIIRKEHTGETKMKI